MHRRRGVAVAAALFLGAAVASAHSHSEINGEGLAEPTLEDAVTCGHASVEQVGTAETESAVEANAESEPRGDARARRRWFRQTLRLTVDPSLDAISENALEAVVAAAREWERVAPGLPRLTVEYKGSSTGYDPRGENENTIRFAPNGAADTNGALAVTIVEYDRTTGEILDADIVINGEYRFSQLNGDETDGKFFDLQNMLTHELGHLLGLDEDREHEDATMHASARPREVSKRTLSAADAVNVSARYETEISPDWLPEDDANLEADAGSPAPQGAIGCSLRTAKPKIPLHAWAFLGLALFAIRRGRLAGN